MQYVMVINMRHDHLDPQLCSAKELRNALLCPDRTLERDLISHMS